MKFFNACKKFFFNITTVDYKKMAEQLEEFWGKPPVDACCYHYNVRNEYCGRKKLKGADMCYWHARSKEKYKPEIIKEYFECSDNLKDVIEKEVAKGGTLEGAYLRGANIGGNLFERGANLKNANLCYADLSDVHLSYGTLENARLLYANLESTYLSAVELSNANFTGARLFNVKSRNNDFTTVKGISKSSFFRWKFYIFPTCRILASESSMSSLGTQGRKNLQI